MARNVAFVVAATLLVLGATLAYGQVCGNDQCQPSGSPSCKRGNKVPFIFQLGFQQTPSTLPVNDTYRNTTIGPRVANYAYCAEVDQLQAFQLLDSITTANNLQTQIQAQYPSWPYNNGSNAAVFSTVYAAVRGTGPSVDQNAPTLDSTTAAPVIIWDATSLGCPKTAPTAVARFLILNVTMTNGLYKLGGSDGIPIQTGFDPTCDGDNCLLGNADLCIGTAGRKNCAKCYDQATALSMHLNTTIFTAYYGTDNSGRSFKSGTLNPLNFEQFAWEPVYKSVSDGVLG